MKPTSRDIGAGSFSAQIDRILCIENVKYAITNCLKLQEESKEI